MCDKTEHPSRVKVSIGDTCINPSSKTKAKQAGAEAEVSTPLNLEICDFEILRFEILRF